MKCNNHRFNDHCNPRYILSGFIDCFGLNFVCFSRLEKVVLLSLLLIVCLRSKMLMLLSLLRKDVLPKWELMMN